MKRDRLEFPDKDLPLKDDVRALGTLVGDMLREQGGEALFEAVEDARRAAIRRRIGEARGEDDLRMVLHDVSPDFAQQILRGFSTYFQMVNLAEKVHRIRRRRDYLRDNDSPQPYGLEATMREIANSGTGAADVATFLEGLMVEPVFTAHPTEATRRTILRKQQRIARRLVERMDPSLTPEEERAALARIRADLTSSWQTEEHPSARMTVADEREHVLFYLTDVIYRVVPVFYEVLAEALARVHGENAVPPTLPTIVRFASWVGGDMDGNPNVSADTIRDTLRHQRDLILARYSSEVATLAQDLSQSIHIVDVDPQLRARIEAGTRLFPQVSDAVPLRHRDMPYRVFLTLIGARLEATRLGKTNAYATLDELDEDIELIATSLRDHRGEHAGLFTVRRLQRRIRTFGFHLATLDVRQDSLVHRGVIGRGLREPDWLALPAAERTVRLREALERDTRPTALDAEDRKTLEVFRAIAECRERYGTRAIGPYIISMAQGADDVLSVLLLARWGGLTGADGRVPLDVAPLFETVEDLENGPGIMRALLHDPGYRAHIERRGTRQTIMIGYSDSNKDGGIAASRWALRRAEAAFAAVMREADVALTIFHGRGGTVSRGGGRTHMAVLGAPPGTVDGRLRVTEQGEIIDAKYGLRGIALRTLEQAVASVALATARPGSEVNPGWHAVMDTIAAESRVAYRRLVYESPGFVEYFRQATPVDVIERMQIGSRPASRRSGSGLDNLRAIPWVFAWTQSRQIIPGWFGFGTALAIAVERHGRAAVSGMLEHSFFVGGLVDDVEMVLAKVDMDIAARYAALADSSLQHFYAAIRAEYELTVDTLLDLKGADHLLAHDPTLRRAILLRNPYVDPMSMLQVDLLARWRASGSEDRDLLAALFASVNGIAHGLQNTG